MWYIELTFIFLSQMYSTVWKANNKIKLHCSCEQLPFSVLVCWLSSSKCKINII